MYRATTTNSTPSGTATAAWISLLYFAIITSIITTVVVRALPSGAPVCTIGDFAPGDPHISPGRRPQKGSLASAGFIVKIGDVTLSTETITTLQANVDLPVVVTSDTGEQPFRGALVIASKPGVTIENVFSLSDAELAKLQISTICPSLNADGVTHVDNELKTSVEATLRFDENIQELLLDVNVVVINKIVSLGGSFYYWSQFKINVEGATAAPTPSRPRLFDGCGLFRLGLFCPVTACGFFGRLIYGDDFC